MSEDPKLFVTDFSKGPDAERWREQRERARVEARGRYRDHLSAVLAEHGVVDSSGLAEVAMAALFDWPRVSTGELCQCGCHPRLGSDDLHDGGFNCGCTKSAEQHRSNWAKWQAERNMFWNSPEGQQIKAREAAEEAALQAWLATQPDVVVSSHGGLYPEQWEGTVAGHSFYFRERWDDWRIELDLRPNGIFGQVITGVADDGMTETKQFEHTSGDVIAEGTTFTEGYGDNPMQRAQFIVDTIRTHLARQICTHQVELTMLGGLAGEQVRWCPSCGARLHGGATE